MVRRTERTDEDERLDRLKEVAEEQEEKHDDGIHAHYGMKKEEWKKMSDDAFVQVYRCDKYSDVLDGLFPGLDGEGRLKVHAYAWALVEWFSLQKGKRDLLRGDGDSRSAILMGVVDMSKGGRGD